MSIRIAAIGLSHYHIYNQVGALLDAGAELVWVYDPDAARVAEFTGRYPQAKVARSVEEILEDETIHLVASALIPNERAPLGVRVMQHGKDYSSTKPAFVTLEQLADVALWPLCMSGYSKSILPYCEMRKAGMLIDCKVDPCEVETYGIKYSCMPPPQSEAQKHQSPVDHTGLGGSPLTRTL